MKCCKGWHGHGQGHGRGHHPPDHPDVQMAMLGGVVTCVMAVGTTLLWAWLTIRGVRALETIAMTAALDEMGGMLTADEKIDLADCVRANLDLPPLECVDICECEEEAGGEG